MKEIFFTYKGVFGHDINVNYLSGLDFILIGIAAKGDATVFMHLAIKKCVFINGKQATDKLLKEITASDVVEIYEAISRQTTKLTL